SDRTRMSRRDFLWRAGAAGVGAATLTVLPPLIQDSVAEASTHRTRHRRRHAGSGRWSDRSTWGGSVPGPNAAVTIDGPVLLDMDASVATLIVAPGGSLTFEPSTDHTLTSSGNVIVRGTLSMVPASSQVNHRMVFVDVDESKFQGGG